jgi:CheY-like chemotaxis protein
MAHHILIIDDEKLLCDLIKQGLAARCPGCKVKLAHTGKEGLAYATANQPDIIILDIMLPHENGRKLARQLKADPTTKNIPIIASSGAGSPFRGPPPDEEELFAESLRKPYDIDILIEAINRAMDTL